METYTRIPLKNYKVLSKRLYDRLSLSTRQHTNVELYSDIHGQYYFRVEYMRGGKVLDSDVLLYVDPFNIGLVETDGALVHGMSRLTLNTIAAKDREPLLNIYRWHIYPHLALRKKWAQGGIVCCITFIDYLEVDDPFEGITNHYATSAQYEFHRSLMKRKALLRDNHRQDELEEILSRPRKRGPKSAKDLGYTPREHRDLKLAWKILQGKI